MNWPPYSLRQRQRMTKQLPVDGTVPACMIGRVAVMFTAGNRWEIVMSSSERPPDLMSSLVAEIRNALPGTTAQTAQFIYFGSGSQATFVLSAACPPAPTSDDPGKP